MSTQETSPQCPSTTTIEKLKHLLGQNQYDLVEKLCTSALKKFPRSPSLIDIFVASLSKQQRFFEALELLERLNESDAKSMAALSKKAFVLIKLHRFDEAVTVSNTIIQQSPVEPIGFELTGYASQKSGKMHLALNNLKKALELGTNKIISFELLASTQLELGLHADALKTLNLALSMHPNNANLLANKGACLRISGQLTKSIQSYTQAINIDSKLAAAHNGLGVSLQGAGSITAAIAAFDNAIFLDPEFSDAYSNRNLALNYSSSHTKAQVYQFHKEFDHKFKRQPIGARITKQGEKPRVGYLSADLRRHSVAYFFYSLLKFHNQKEFDIFCYHNSNLEDDITEELKKIGTHWRSVKNLTDDQLRDRIKTDCIDILIDLSGHTAGNRLAALTARVAPIQATWLGYPNTTGVSAFDFRITDSNADPDDADQRFYTEELIRLKGSFLCYWGDTTISHRKDPPSSTADYISFGSFNNYAKFSPLIIEAWIEILKRTPGSRLFLKNHSLIDQQVRNKLVQQFENSGIAPERLIIPSRGYDQTSHMLLYNEVDIALDTFPYNGTTTTCEAIWMGVPVITLAGDRHASRVGASILRSIDQPQFITHSVNHYIEVASMLAHERANLTRLRKKLRATLISSPLGSAKVFAQEMERAMIEMMRKGAK